MKAQRLARFAAAAVTAFGAAAAPFPAAVPAARAQYATEATQALNHGLLLRQLQTEALQLEGIVRSIQSLNFRSLDQLVSGMGQLVGALGQAQTLDYQYVGAAQRFQALYQDVGAVRSIRPGARDLTGYLDRFQQMAGATANAMQEAAAIRAAAVEQQRQSGRMLGAQLAASDAAPGTTAAIQAGNQVLGTAVSLLQEQAALSVSYQEATLRVMEQQDTSGQMARMIAENALAGIGTGKTGPYTDPFAMALP